MTTINHRVLSDFKPKTQNKASDQLFDLHYFGLLRLEGEQAAEFLQGQLSSNMQEINEEQMRPALRLNLKGRIMDILYVFKDEGALYLLLPKDMLLQTKDALMKAAVFSKVSISEKQTVDVFGFELKAALEPPLSSKLQTLSKYAFYKSEGCAAFSLGSNLFILISNESCAQQLKQNYPYNSALAWQQLALASGVVSLYPESRALFLPHRLGFHQDAFIDFNKGCYKGQEIVARTHFKATIKHELKLFLLTTKEAIFSGQKVYAIENNQEIAELIDYAPRSTGELLVALSILKELEPARVKFEQHQTLSQLMPFACRER